MLKARTSISTWSAATSGSPTSWSWSGAAPSGVETRASMLIPPSSVLDRKFVGKLRLRTPAAACPNFLNKTPVPRHLAKHSRVTDPPGDALRVQVFEQGQHRPPAGPQVIAERGDRDRTFARHQRSHQLQGIRVCGPRESDVVGEPDQVTASDQG